MILHSLVSVRHRNLAQCVVSCEIGRREQDFQVHHIVYDDLGDCKEFINVLSIIIDEKGGIGRTWKSVGSDESQLRVHPTMGLYLAASAFAKLFTAV